MLIAMFSASIVTYKTDLRELERVLELLESGGAERIYVVDNGMEESIRNLCQGNIRVEYIASENIGYGSAHNIALRMSIERGEKYHLVLNSDLQFAPEDIDRMIEYMNANPRCGLLHPRIMGEDGKDQYTVRMLPTPFDLVVRRFFPSSWFQRSRDRYLLKHINHAERFDVAYVQGSFMMLRVEALKEQGLFDERFFMYPEDIDLSRRIAEKWSVTYYPDVKIVHAHRGASYTNCKMLMIHIRNMIKYFNKWGWLRDPQRKALNAELGKKGLCDNRGQ